ncbi:hypothetical protein K491DRAFT_682636 [Lophiostoma macrostomum CBS 122681]|uniref:Uncharacterized protein n=1 Tax=Lophiostoma macrostomum CBS 122681 TaxID=1314788 RepID=A0A6A6SSZ3_9PLEO|nr:hypothetical protein K491DRAFT_682636 [Lophiostoma macrostomum CBS 122681]
MPRMERGLGDDQSARLSLPTDEAAPEDEPAERVSSPASVAPRSERARVTASVRKTLAGRRRAPSTATSDSDGTASSAESTSSGAASSASWNTPARAATPSTVTNTLSRTPAKAASIPRHTEEHDEPGGVVDLGQALAVHTGDSMQVLLDMADSFYQNLRRRDFSVADARKTAQVMFEVWSKAGFRRLVRHMRAFACSPTIPGQAEAALTLTATPPDPLEPKNFVQDAAIPASYMTDILRHKSTEHATAILSTEREPAPLRSAMNNAITAFVTDHPDLVVNGKIFLDGVGSDEDKTTQFSLPKPRGTGGVLLGKYVKVSAPSLARCGRYKKRSQKASSRSRVGWMLPWLLGKHASNHLERMGSRKVDEVMEAFAESCGSLVDAADGIGELLLSLWMQGEPFKAIGTAEPESWHGLWDQFAVVYGADRLRKEADADRRLASPESSRLHTEDLRTIDVLLARLTGVKHEGGIFSEDEAESVVALRWGRGLEVGRSGRRL